MSVLTSTSTSLLTYSAFLAIGAKSYMIRVLVSSFVSPVRSSTRLSFNAAFRSAWTYRAVSTNCVKITAFLLSVSNTLSLTSCSLSVISFLSAYGFIRSKLCFRGSRSWQSFLMSLFISCFL